MDDGVEVKIVGLPEFSSRLRAFGLDMQKRVVRSAALAAATVFKKAAVAAAPVLQTPRKGRIAGVLKKAIYAGRSRSKSSPGTEVAVVGVKAGREAAKKGRDAFYWRWVESGHVASGPGKRLKGGDNSKALQRTRLAAAGKFVPGVHFLARSFQSNQAQAIKAFNDRIEARIVKANKELNNK